MTDSDPLGVPPRLRRFGVRLVFFWVVSAGFGFLLAGLVYRWKAAPDERGLRAAELALVGLANLIAFGAVLWPRAFRLGPSGGRERRPE